MDQIKIGKFIAQKRKEQNMTQAILAEKLGITDRAVSKWETGKSLPDASIMLELCSLLGITVNELLCGEALQMENYNEIAEKNLLEALKQKEAADKRLLRLEIIIGFVSLAFLAAMIAIGMIFFKDTEKEWVLYVLLGVGMFQFLVCALFALRIEQVAGYYECRKCGHRYEPTYLGVTAAMHVNRTRFMKCPACGKWSWQKKVISKK